MSNSEFHAQGVIQKAIVGAVVIGRNEGARLEVCLRSLVDQVNTIIYVDSGSTDGSVAFAQGLGVIVVSLDMSKPFTAARARNTGFQKLIETNPEIDFVQFVDGDCEVINTWIPAALEKLQSNSKIAVVCGRRRERFPEASIYNQLCDSEWNTPVGEAKACGGDALMRTAALKSVSGYNDQLIAGEEPELCVRLRHQGWTIWRLDAEMTLHDAAMMSLSQWWRRTTRAGYAYALGAKLHGAPPEKHWVKECKRIWLWGLIIPVFILTFSFTIPWGWLAWCIYPLQMLRIAKQQGGVYGFFCVFGKFPELQGLLNFYCDLLLGRQRGLIEYK